ncbi:MAG: HWE histidine kinase domain-containing protein [Pseudomonadota bacterium]
MTSDYLSIDDDQYRRNTAALEAANFGVFEFEPATERAFWDDRVRSLWGFKPGETIDYAYVVSKVHEDDREYHNQATANALDPNGSGEMDIEYRLLARDDQPETWIRAKARTLFENGVAVRLVGTVEDITVRKKAELRNEVLMRELQHRLTNTLTIVTSVVNGSKGSHSSTEDFAEALTGRIHALSQAQELLRRNEWQDVWLSHVCARVLDGVVGDSGRIRSTWDSDILIPEQYVQTATMAIYELAANALKYGALSVPDGVVEVSGHSDGTSRRFEWKERGGPKPQDGPFAPNGFGSLLLGTIWPEELNGVSTYGGDEDGAVYQMVLE